MDISGGGVMHVWGRGIHPKSLIFQVGDTKANISPNVALYLIVGCLVLLFVVVQHLPIRIRVGDVPISDINPFMLISLQP